MFLINCVALKPVLIFTRRRAARLADSPLMTVVQRGGNGCCSGRGKMRRLENEKYLPRWETIRLVKAALRKATISSLRSRASAMVTFKRLSSCGTPIAVPISSRPPVKWSSNADLLHHSGRMVVGQHHAHDAKPQFFCSRAKRGNQKVG